MEKRELILVKLNELAPINLEIAKLIAAEFDVKDKSIIAMATRNGIAYNRKPKLNKAGKPTASKEKLVAVIAENLGLEASDLAGLEKATKASLDALVEATEAVDFGVEAETDVEAETEVAEG